MWGCGPVDVNEWHDAADEFIHGDYERQLRISEQTLKKQQGGNLTGVQKLELDRAKGILDEWDDKYGDFQRHGELAAFGKGNPGNFYRDESMEIVEIFDKAACEMQAIIELQPEGSFSIRPPLATTTPESPGGSWFGGPDDSHGVGIGTSAMIMVGIGLAGFIGYKAITE